MQGEIRIQALCSVHYEQPCALPDRTRSARRFAENYALAELVYGHVL